jgi:hypothetical protein
MNELSSKIENVCEKLMLYKNKFSKYRKASASDEDFKNMIYYECGKANIRETTILRIFFEKNQQAGG